MIASLTSILIILNNMLQPTWHPILCFYHFTLKWTKVCFFLHKFSGRDAFEIFLKKRSFRQNTHCWRHRNPKLQSLMSCRCNSTKKSLFGCTGQLDLKLAFLFWGQRKENQEDFLVVEAGQRNFVALLMIFMKS